MSAFTAEEMKLLLDALAVQQALTETGTIWSLEDARRMDKDTRKEMGILEFPSKEQLEKSLKLQELRRKLQRDFR